jgi:putative Mg2+ transporter-C (MgtC) family protein
MESIIADMTHSTFLPAPVIWARFVGALLFGAVIDPLRVIEAVTAGVAFLAAGFIVFAKGEVKGLTTGAGIWLAAAIGLSIGFGYWMIALSATILGVVVLALLRRFESFVELKAPK